MGPANLINNTGFKAVFDLQVPILNKQRPGVNSTKKKTIHTEFLCAFHNSVKHGGTHARFLFPR